MNIHHLGYLVKKIDKAQAAFEKLGYVVTQPVVYDAYRKVDIVFLHKDGYVVELVSPASPDSVVSELIKKYRNMPYHICYTSENFDDDVAALCSNGYVKMGEPCLAPAINNKRVVFLMSPAIGIIEVSEE